MISVALLLASGLPFWLGCMLALLAAALRARRIGWIGSPHAAQGADAAAGAGSRQPRVWPERAAMSVGALSMAMSATPIAALLAWGAAAAAGAWLLAPRRALNALVALLVVAISALEAPYTLTPRLLPLAATSAPGASGNQAPLRIEVIGDSLTAGIGDDVQLWPALLAKRHPHCEITSRAQAGATCKSAARQSEQIAPDTRLVILLIGGNDIVAGASVAQFEQSLDALLSRAGRDGARLVLFELPAPPLGNGYIAAQRRLAARHHALLVPRWRLALVLAAPGATTDGLHLSQAGQAALCELASSIVATAVVK